MSALLFFLCLHNSHAQDANSEKSREFVPDKERMYLPRYAKGRRVPNHNTGTQVVFDWREAKNIVRSCVSNERLKRFGKNKLYIWYVFDVKEARLLYIGLQCVGEENIPMPLTNKEMREIEEKLKTLSFKFYFPDKQIPKWKEIHTVAAQTVSPSQLLSEQKCSPQ